MSGRVNKQSLFMITAFFTVDILWFIPDPFVIWSSTSLCSIYKNVTAPE